MPLISVSAPGPRVAMHGEVSVTADQSAEITRLVIRTLCRPERELAYAEERVVGRQGRTGLPVESHVLPPALREKTMISTRGQFRSVLEEDSESRFRRSPDRE